MPLVTDPIDWALDDNGDWIVTTDVQFVRGVEAVVQLARIALALWQGEWFANLDLGVDYEGKILAYRFNSAVVRTEVRDALLGVPGIVELLKLEISFDASERRVSVVWRARTEFGDTVSDNTELNLE